eukprot:Gregarina_sp_Poly_1__3463@NODE_2003_length_2884_cov_96_903798_g1294_i0_p2_GENE_NODE_2003_length_2884_cov_96_903798_g1294_i0NODE_2003_length_2884_cov_96_903798_g1294_i0_p2_ORF_typecomplete_len307_score21_59MFS_1/PF07690_16/1e05MFS_1/PF07690_16/7_6e05MFS_4/PF06779_14/3_5e03MFS_4/PF06779_14/7_5e06_NODE_2003_length_2884_cov_96_903798_g1294_i016352555
MSLLTCLIVAHFLIFPVPLARDCGKERSPKQSPLPVIRSSPSPDADDTSQKKRRLASQLSFELDRDAEYIAGGTEAGVSTHFSTVAFSRRFAMYLAAQAFMQGTGAATIGNVSLLRESYDMDAISESSLLSRPHQSSLWTLTKIVRLVSIGNFTGRLLAAISSQYIQTSKYHRFFVLTAISMAIGQLMLLMVPTSQGPFLFSLFLTACCLGSNFAIGPVWVMQNLSVDHFASLQAVVMCGVAASTFYLSLFTGNIYEAEAMKQVSRTNFKAEQHLICRGPTCFRTVHAWELVINLISLGLVLAVRL